MTLNEILKQAYKKINALGHNAELSNLQLSDGISELNLMLKTWENEGLGKFSKEIINYPLVKSDELIAIDGLNYRCIKNTVLTLFNQPIVGDDWDIYFEPDGENGEPVADEVVGIDGAVYQCILPHFSTWDKNPVSGGIRESYWFRIAPTETYSLTIDNTPVLINEDVLIDKTKSRSLWAEAIQYNSKIGLSLNAEGDYTLPETTREISQAKLYNGSEFIKELDLITFENYYEINDKLKKGQPEEIYFNEVTKRFILYPGLDLSTIDENEAVPEYSLELLVNKNLLIPETLNGEIDLPVNWVEAVIYNLSARLADNYGLPFNERQLLESRARYAKNQAVFGNYQMGPLSNSYSNSYDSETHIK